RHEEKKPAAPHASATATPDREKTHEEEVARQIAMETDPKLKKLWKVRLDGVEISDVREVWIEDERWDGHGTAHGGFFLRPKLTLEITPTTIDLADGVLLAGKTTLASPLSVKVSGAIEKMNPEQHK